jgi:hypothetical protein
MCRNIAPRRRTQVRSINLEHILRDTHGHASQARALSERVFGEFLELFSLAQEGPARECLGPAAATES